MKYLEEKRDNLREALKSIFDEILNQKATDKGTQIIAIKRIADEAIKDDDR